MKKNKIDSKEAVRIITEFFKDRLNVIFAYLHGYAALHKLDRYPTTPTNR